LAKGESKGIKLVELFANWVVERKNMINDYLRGELALRVLGGVDFRRSVDFELLPWLELFLALLCHFAWLYRFSCRLLAFMVFLLPNDLLELFMVFWVF
jgi:hypothetical protein